MKILKKTGYFLLGITVLLNLIILVSGKLYIYRAIYHFTADLDDYKIFENREVKSTPGSAWTKSADYNKFQLSESQQREMHRLQSVGLVIIQHDSIQYEEYWLDYDATSYAGSFSMAKTIVSILIGIALEEGKINSIDQSVGDYVPYFNKGKREKITIKHLLTMSSGLSWNESYFNPFSITTEAYYGSDLQATVQSMNVEEEPGRRYDYVSGNSQILAMVLTNATGTTMSEYASEKLWIPIGAERPALWSLDRKDGIEKAYCCFTSTARDFARIGKLFLDSGVVNQQRIVSREYMTASVEPAPLVDKDGRKNTWYGYSWWLISYKNHDVFYARGILGQYIFVIPSLDMILVRLGIKRDGQSDDTHPDDVYLYLDIAIDASK